jgi:hypothetical protein
VAQTFHLSFAVPDLDAVRVFYLDVLGCQLGRDRGSWIDVLFFGHQLTIHQESDRISAVAIDHFGPILDKSTWLGIAETCKAHSAEFVVKPRVVLAGTDSESGKFVISDPAGNLLEFKYYGDYLGTVASDST